jgi:hypothetical protein
MGPWFKTSLMLLLAVMPGGLLVLAAWALWGAWQRGGIPALRREVRRGLGRWRRTPPVPMPALAVVATPIAHAPERS